MKNGIANIYSLFFLVTTAALPQVNPSTKILEKAFDFDFKSVEEQYKACLNNGCEGDSLYYDFWYRGLKLEKNKHYIDARDNYEKALHLERSEISSYEVKFSIGRLELLKGMGAQGTTFLYEFISEAQKEINGENVMWSLTEKGKNQLNEKVELALELMSFAAAHELQKMINSPMGVLRRENPYGKNAERFLKKLRDSGNLSSFFNDTWTLVYYKDDRCEGITMGRLEDVTSEQIDRTIEIPLNNDGYGWGECERKERSSYDFPFNLKQLTKGWNRYEMADYRQMEMHIFYIVGGGESDYLKIYFNEQKLIVKLEYRSEDPG
ncbi:hypothetical protein [Maribacter sp. 4G9]|uniref:hypothetical protein n=1 Tax=Maribacter sp. 4G9 TaxID=1889777 RepID=UPI000C1580C6|nr:hypothetical protein [Maribacter sp. 4G9]PIB38407.1 hypothetical protein BFP75_15990 [Maribacter sp. 4G9]